MKNLMLCIAALLIMSACNKDDDMAAPATIESLLSTSKTAYQNANANSWVEISEDEYNLMATSLKNVSKRGTTDANFQLATNNVLGDRTFSNNQNGLEIPIDDYLFAFKYNSHSDTSNRSGRVKRSADKTSNFITVGGGALPIHNSVESFFVLKESNHKYSDVGYLSFWAEGSIAHSSIAAELPYADGDAVNLNKLTMGIAKYQGLSSPDKQW